MTKHLLPLLALAACTLSTFAHEAARVGPTGGRLLTNAEPHIEFLVNKDKKVELRFVDDHNKVIPQAEQEVSVTLGDRAKPTKLTFAKEGDKLVSDGTIPAGDDYPTVVQVRLKPGAKLVSERFNLNLSECPTCDNPEYACKCAHDGADKKKK